ncbi:hypothetical protein [Leuconostoc mesenteroides]|uniref:hypothetical protein n=1 Tax=Leuconostoc mesenteroides TaxID=1245 RepID=UPI00235FC458|nr:hypothetical protein [Leuconostoc mesenteroides]
MDTVFNKLESFKNNHRFIYFIIGFILLILAIYLNFISNSFITNSAHHIVITLNAGFLVFINFVLIYIAAHYLISFMFSVISFLTKEKKPVRLINYYTALASFLYALSTVPWTVADALLTITLAIMLPVIISFYKGGQGTKFIDRLDNALYSNDSSPINTEHTKQEKSNILDLSTYSIGKWTISYDSSLIVTSNIKQWILVTPKDSIYKDTPLLVMKLGRDSLTIKQSSIYKIILEDKNITIIKK